MMTEKKYSWEDIHALVLKLSEKVSKPDVIFSLGKGGTIPGVILAEMYGCDNHNIGLKSYYDRIGGEVEEYQNIKNIKKFKDANILIVDDIADSGKTLQYVFLCLNSKDITNYNSATIFYKPRSIVRPDAYSIELANDDWVVFPWEK